MSEGGTPVRRFTVDEANQLVPVLDGLLKRLHAMQGEARAKYEEMRDIRAVGYRKDGNLIMLTDYQLAKREFDQVVQAANQLLGEIHENGCRVTDVELGLIDFPAELNGESVFLCWQRGEAEVGYYHGLEEGYAGRKPLPLPRSKP
jgi:hypothetical protein